MARVHQWHLRFAEGHSSRWLERLDPLYGHMVTDSGSATMSYVASIDCRRYITVIWRSDRCLDIHWMSRACDPSQTTVLSISGNQTDAHKHRADTESTTAHKVDPSFHPFTCRPSESQLPLMRCHLNSAYKQWNYTKLLSTNLAYIPRELVILLTLSCRTTAIHGEIALTLAI